MDEELLLPLPIQHRLTLSGMLEIKVPSLEKEIGCPHIPLIHVWLPVPAHKGPPMKPSQQVSTKKTICFRKNSVRFLQKSSKDRDSVEHVGEELRQS